MRNVSTLALAAVAAVALLPGTAFASAGGVSGPAFYVDGTLYRTVGTPTDFSGTGAAADSYDVIWAIGSQAYNVAEAAPGDRDYNGGRWQVHALQYDDFGDVLAAADANGSGDLDSEEEVQAAIAAGVAWDGGVVASFECPVIPLPRGR